LWRNGEKQGTFERSNYNAHFEHNGGVWTGLSSGPSLSAVIGTPGDGTYVMRVQGCNAIGCGLWTLSPTVTIYHPPGTPASISVPATSSGSLTVSWAPSSGTVTAYTLERSDNGSAYAAIYTGGATSVAQSFPATSDYAYRVKACNGPACSGYATSGTVVVTIPPASGPSLSVPGISNNGCYTESWTGVAGATVYSLNESTNGAAWTNVQANASGAWSVCGKPNGTYSYYVQACNAGGCGPISNVATVTVALIPSTPSSVFLTQSGTANRQVFRLSWAASSLATSYSVKRSDTGAIIYSGTALTAVVASNVPPPFDIGFSTLVQACNAAGCAVWVSPE
jgi:hypothetical protein